MKVIRIGKERIELPDLEGRIYITPPPDEPRHGLFLVAKKTFDTRVVVNAVVKYINYRTVHEFTSDYRIREFDRHLTIPMPGIDNHGFCVIIDRSIPYNPAYDYSSLWVEMGKPQDNYLGNTIKMGPFLISDAHLFKKSLKISEALREFLGMAGIQSPSS